MAITIKIPASVLVGVRRAESQGHQLVSQGCSLFRCVRCNHSGFLDLESAFPKCAPLSPEVIIGIAARPIYIGTRVEIHPRFDLWVRGARFGVVRSFHATGNGRVLIKVKLDKVRKLFRCYTDEGSSITCRDLKALARQT